MFPQRALGIQWQAVGSVEMEVFVIERTLHSGTGISTVWHSSFLPSGYEWIRPGAPPSLSQLGKESEWGGHQLFLSQAPGTASAGWLPSCNAAAGCIGPH